MKLRSLLEHSKDSAPQQCAYCCGRDYTPALLLTEGVSGEPARTLIGRKSERVAKPLKYRVQFGTREEMEHLASVS